MKDKWFRLCTVFMQNADPPIYTDGDRVAVVEPFQPGSSGPAFPPELIRDALAAVDGADPPFSPTKQAGDRYAPPVIAQAIASHRGGRALDAEGKSVFEHLKASDLVLVVDVKIARPGKGSDTRKGLVLTPAGKVALTQSTDAAADTPPAVPQSPAVSTTGNAGNAGGEPLSGPPQPLGGCGGNAGG